MSMRGQIVELGLFGEGSWETDLEDLRSGWIL